MAGLSTIPMLLEGFKGLVSLADKSTRLEFNEKLIEIQQNLLNLQREYSEVIADNQRLTSELKGVLDQLSMRANGFTEDGVYWQKNTGSTRQGPFCPVCFGNSGKLVPLLLGGALSDQVSVSMHCQNHEDRKVLSYKVLIALVTEAGLRVKPYVAPSETPRSRSVSWMG